MTPDFNFRPDRFERLTPDQQRLIAQFVSYTEQELAKNTDPNVTMTKFFMGFRAQLSQYEAQEFDKAMMTLIFGI